MYRKFLQELSNGGKEELEGGSYSHNEKGKRIAWQQPADMNSQSNIQTLVEECWEKIDWQCSQQAPQKTPSEPSTGWHTVRVFISSTFADFYSEREHLVKQVFPALREWCQHRQLHLVECDLRWGVPKDSTTVNTIRTCLEEIDHCAETNGQPFFISMLGERYGWTPRVDELPQDLVQQYQWVDHMSITAMEIIHGAYRRHNPNAIFLMREAAFLKDVPDKHLNSFKDVKETDVKKMQMLKEKLRSKFPEQVFDYQCKVKGMDTSTGRAKVSLGKLDQFGEIILENMKKAIERCYPRRTGMETLSHDEQETLSHQAYMTLKGQAVMAREAEVEMIMDYINRKVSPSVTMSEGEDREEFQKVLEDFGVSETDHPVLCIMAPPGYGKSSLMAKAAMTAAQQGHHVISHFVGSTPSSYSALSLLNRLCTALTVNKEEGDKTDEKAEDKTDKSEEDLKKQLSQLLQLQGSRGQQVVIFIDALNELACYNTRNHLTWLPPRTPEPVTVIVSTSLESDYTVCKLQNKRVNELHLDRLSEDSVVVVAEKYLGKYGKKLDEEQMTFLRSYPASSVPLWLVTVCEELRIFGDFRMLTRKIRSLPDNIDDLLADILQRVTREDASGQVTKLLSLLYCSTGGFREKFIPPLLAEKGTKEPAPYTLWANLRRTLKSLIRVIETSGGQQYVQFIHASVGQAVGQQLLDDPTTLRSWQTTLADFYQYRCDDLYVQAEQCPDLLAEAGLKQRLVDFIRTSRAGRLCDLNKKRRLLNGLRCHSSAFPGSPTSGTAKLCQLCASRPGPGGCFPMKNQCIICHWFTTGKDFMRPAHLCMRHAGPPIKSFQTCIVCNRNANALGEGTMAKVCVFCNSGRYFNGCAKILTSE